MNAPEPVTTGSVLVTVAGELDALFGELAARRKFDQQVTDFLRSVGMTEAFERYRAAIAEAAAVAQPDAG